MCILICNTTVSRNYFIILSFILPDLTIRYHRTIVHNYSDHYIKKRGICYLFQYEDCT